jgi:hypothetical protein
VVEAVAIIFAAPVADAVAVLLRVVQALMFPDGITALTVTADEFPTASVPGAQLRVPLTIEQFAPELCDEMVHVRSPPRVGKGSDTLTPDRDDAPAAALFDTVIVKDAVPPSI